MIELPRNTFYYRSTAATPRVTDGRLLELIGDIKDDFPGYGYQRVMIELARRGIVVNHKRVNRVMQAKSPGRQAETAVRAHDR